MKHIFATTALAFATALALQAKDAKDILVYINPGHGGHDSDDRNVVIYPYTQGDPEGYWESNSNLEKGLTLRQLLQDKGYKVQMSRTTNTTADDLGLSTISSLANKANSDIFFSIHSNATGSTSRRNFPLILYKGWDNDPYKPNDKVVATMLNTHLLENKATYWTSTNINVRGDWSFYNAQWGTSGLGVLRNLTVTGVLSEGSFHDYIPETYRLMNKDFCWLEAHHFRKTVDQYFEVDGVSFGAIAGRINDERMPRQGNYAMFGEDKKATVDGATITLLDADGKEIDKYTTETKHYNGIFAFRQVQPGTYTLRYEHENYYPMEKEVKVTANEVTYANQLMTMRRLTPPEVVSYSPMWTEDNTEGVQCNEKIVLTFNWDMDAEETEAAFSITPAVEGTITWEDTNYRMVFTPSQPLDINTLYTVTLSTRAAHPDKTTPNHNLQEEFSFSFRTCSRNYMDIIGGFPADNDRIHYKDATIEFRFDKLLNSSSIFSHIDCVDSNGNKVKFNSRKMSSSKDNSPYGFFRVPFTSALTVGERYHLTIDAGISDRDGITMREPVDVWFTAEDAGEVKSEFTMLDDMDAADYTYIEDASINVATQKVAANTSAQLFGKGCVALSYTFPEEEGCEVFWQRNEASDVAVSTDNAIGVHVNGDLTYNELYLQFASETDVQYVKVCDLDFLGWRYFVAPTTALESGKTYNYTGVKIVQNPGQVSVTGTVMLDDISSMAKTPDGVDDIIADNAGVSVYPNPATELLIANAPALIHSVQLYSLNGSKVAEKAGNVLNVSAVADGNYILVVKTAETTTSHKVIIRH